MNPFLIFCIAFVVGVFLLKITTLRYGYLAGFLCALTLTAIVYIIESTIL